MREVKVTVLMPAYNAEAYIAEAIESVLLQSFGDFELLIVNDGSTDGTVEIIRSFNDDRIVLIGQENRGIAAALNTGLKHARAPYIARFDADDICYPDRLEKQYHFIHSNPEYIVVGSSAAYMDASGDYVFTYHPAGKTNSEIKKLPYNICPFIHAAVMYKKEAIISTGYNIHAHSFEDHLLWQNIRDEGKMYNLPDSLVRVRLNPGSITMDESKRPAAFHAIKNKALREKTIDRASGNQLLAIIRAQDKPRIKEEAYYSLLAKKFLWNNYNPEKARQHMKKAIGIKGFDLKGYLMFAASYLPRNVIVNLYTLFAAK